MKKIKFIIGVFFIVLSVNAQAVIGKTSPQGSGIVDFNTADKSGIVLPWVTALPTGTALAGGVMLFDANLKKVVYYNETNWVDLSRRTGSVDLSIQASVPEAATKGTVIGAESSSVDGVLVLESSNKALILPRLASPHLNIIKPMPGTICYDTNKKMVCIYNGSEWTFWK
ncbi:hypothetical protein [Flavobacterium hydatis]|uniref:Uncharacterized protein n=1 Tax=Flavobacterium hydatis TaxID=991 RepID=A0A086AEE6_FLAHY|nr:hypothetical protein [Flavobacterium hydatis]KFF15060.1 hypothetical protein IW20_15475 [Flavobacterium hydatis]OXA91988.1 hypothetical protein B0A62_16455 [Flavobacterium hydatis]